MLRERRQHEERMNPSHWRRLLDNGNDEQVWSNGTNAFYKVGPEFTITNTNVYWTSAASLGANDGKFFVVWVAFNTIYRVFGQLYKTL
jgi:hypothetical protein